MKCNSSAERGGIIMVRKTVKATKSQVQGGRGEVEFEHILDKDELNGHGSLYAKIRLKPGCSVGYHKHIGNTEPYYILEGHGTFIDNDGTRTEVGPGDVCVIEVGQGHSMENNSDQDLVFLSLIHIWMLAQKQPYIQRVRNSSLVERACAENVRG